jgi:hypothetical protein
MRLGKNELIQIISGLGSLHDGTASFFNKYGLDPAPGSQAISELTAFRTKSVQTCYSQSNLLIEVSGDHLISLFKSFTEPVLTIAPWTSVRANLESSALASWLLDPSISARERVQRSLAFRFEGLSQQAKFARSAGLDTSKAPLRINDVENLALSLGFPKVIDKKGNRTGIGQLFPTMTDLISSVLHEEPTYRLCSAFTHAHPWAIQQGSFSQAQDKSPKGSDFSLNTIYFEKKLHPNAIIFLCHTAACAFSKPIWYKAQLYGYALPEFNIILNRVFDTLGVSNTARFWNT